MSGAAANAIWSLTSAAPICASRSCRTAALSRSRKPDAVCAISEAGGGRAALSERVSVSPSVSEAAFDVATAVTGDFIKLTNSPWAFSIEQTRRALGLDRLLVINDFTALALSLPLLQPSELRKVGGGAGVAGAPIALDRCRYRTGRFRR